MKRLYILLLPFLGIMSANAQQANFDKLWTKLCTGNDYWWFNTGASDNNNVVGLAYNPVTNKVLVSRRNTKIYVLNSSTGALEDSLPISPGAESFKHNKIRVTNDGVIYGISLATGAGTCKIWRWANQTATPTECASFTVTERCGDAFALSGSGNSTILYASGAALAGGSSNNNIYVLTTINGVNFTNTATISVPSGSSQWTNRGIDPIGATPSAGLWIDMSGGPARRLDVTGASPSYSSSVAYTTVSGYNPGQAADAYGGVRYLQTSTGRKYIAFAGGNNSGDGRTMRLLDVTDETNVSTLATDTLYDGSSYWNWQTNTNGTGDVAFKDNGNGNYDIFYLQTNNGIAAVRPKIALPMQLGNFSAELNKENIQLKWITTNEVNCESYQIERSIDGENFSTIGKLKAAGNVSNNYDFYDNDALNVKTTKLFYRLKQIDNDGKYLYSKTILVAISTKKYIDAMLLENPVRDNVKLIVSSKQKLPIEISIINVNGQILYNKNITITEGNNNINLEMKNILKGTYFITIKNNNSIIETLSFVK